MKIDLRQQEILLMTNSSFCGREFAVKNDVEEPNGLSQKEQLKKACWNGLIPETLPECFDFAFDKSMFLWDITDANCFIDLEYGKFAPTVEKKCSVNPYLFMELQNYN